MSLMKRFSNFRNHQIVDIFGDVLRLQWRCCHSSNCHYFVILAVLRRNVLRVAGSISAVSRLLGYTALKKHLSGREPLPTLSDLTVPGIKLMTSCADSDVCNHCTNWPYVSVKFPQFCWPCGWCIIGHRSWLCGFDSQLGRLPRCI